MTEIYKMSDEELESYLNSDLSPVEKWKSLKEKSWRRYGKDSEVIKEMNKIFRTLSDDEKKAINEWNEERIKNIPYEEAKRRSFDKFVLYPEDITWLDENSYKRSRFSKK